MKLFLLRAFPFIALLFLIFTISAAVHELNTKRQTPKIISGPGESEELFFKSEKVLSNFELPTLLEEEESFSEKDLLGKYSVINFFSSWCSSCKEEHNFLVLLKESKVIDIYGVAWHDIDQNTRRYLTENKNPYTKVVKDNNGTFAKNIGVFAVPETFVIDSRGKAIARYSGPLKRQTIEDIKNLIR